MCEPQEYPEFPSHTFSYAMATNADDEAKELSFTVLATPQEIEQLAVQGYLIREALFRGEKLARPDGNKRRLLILCYGPTWMRYSPFGVKPENSLVDALLEEATPETKELLGIGGYQ
ncbi:MAG: hypothetical protein F4047_05215 [Caldilineaceae bacterium SB0670_bin_27]|uniref:Uncharacterized protein n=1 Tax=Caldilineaceae bacterium SB0664_bin_27 TaxID=2605260 RepID=A0A6B0Z0H6_9CHLR|nr:hypothetical protein [Caldilineaceae bacterium SB0664_bin_27]MYJ77553.1 hypothetical protein [Caldilineaceae bacterium SB0670_bin_27]